MKLSPTRIKQTLGQFNAQPVPENHPVASELHEHFGDHTFFLAADGLHVVEPADPVSPQAQAGQVIHVADWSDAARTVLAPRVPEATGVVIVFEARQGATPKGADGADPVERAHADSFPASDATTHGGITGSRKQQA
jgi:hypothetical protein